MSPFTNDERMQEEGCFMTLSELKEWQDTFKTMKMKLKTYEENHIKNDMKFIEYKDVIDRKDIKIKELENQLLKLYNLGKTELNNNDLNNKIKEKNIYLINENDRLLNELKESNDLILSLELINKANNDKFNDLLLVNQTLEKEKEILVNEEKEKQLNIEKDEAKEEKGEEKEEVELVMDDDINIIKDNEKELVEEESKKVLQNEENEDIKKTENIVDDVTATINDVIDDVIANVNAKETDNSNVFNMLNFSGTASELKKLMLESGMEIDLDITQVSTTHTSM